MVAHCRQRSSWLVLVLACLCDEVCLVLARSRKELEKTPFPCKEAYDDAEIASWVTRHLQGAQEGNQQPHMLLMLGGSGAGKGTFLSKWKAREEENSPSDLPRLGGFVENGLDDYLRYIPEYAKTVEDPEHVYMDAADACYKGAAIPAAQKAGREILSKKLNLIYEETGKNLDRIKKRVLPPYVEAGYRITVVFIDNDVDTAIGRAVGRFQSTGRYAPEDYIRGTFTNCASSFEALKNMAAVAESVYCDNSGEELKCWADGEASSGALVPKDLLLQGKPVQRGEGEEKRKATDEL